MKKMSIFNVIMASFMAVCIQQVGFAAETAVTTADVSVEQQKQLAELFAVAKNATNAIDQAQALLLGAENTDAQNVATIIEQNSIKVVAEQKLAQLRDQLAVKVEETIAPEGYVSRMVAGAKNIGSGIAAYFTPGKGTPEQKETAKLVIKGLTEQEVKVTEKYASLQKGLASADQAALKVRYDAIITQLEAAIYEQQVITGDTRMGMIKRSLLLGAAAAGTAVGVVLANQYFGQPTTETGSITPTAGPVEVTAGPVEVTAGPVEVSGAQVPTGPIGVPAVNLSDVKSLIANLPPAIVETPEVYEGAEQGPGTLAEAGQAFISKLPVAAPETPEVYEGAEQGPGTLVEAGKEFISKLPVAAPETPEVYEGAETGPGTLTETGKAFISKLPAAAPETPEVYEGAEQGSGTLAEGARKAVGRVSEYLNQPAQQSEIEGLTAEDLGEAVQFAAKKLEETENAIARLAAEESKEANRKREEVKKIIEEGKQSIAKEFEAKTGKTISQAAVELQEAAAQKVEQVKKGFANLGENIKGMLPESPSAKAARQIEEMQQAEAKAAEETAAQEEVAAPMVTEPTEETAE